MRTSNPALSDSTFSQVEHSAANPMTLQGTVNKTAILLMILFVPAVFTWQSTVANPASSTMYIAIGAIVGFILGMVTSFKATWSPITAPL